MTVECPRSNIKLRIAEILRDEGFVQTVNSAEDEKQGMLKLELGLLGNLGDVQNSKFDLELRPMVVISPPLVPLYLRAIFAVQNLIYGPTTYAYGGALGLSFSLLGAGLFVEAGVLPRNVKIDVVTNVPVVGTAAHATRDEFRWFAEGRLGAFYEF